MFSVTTQMGERYQANDLAAAMRELHHEGILRSTMQGKMCLQIPVKDALVIANDNATALAKALVLCWALQCRSEIHHISQVERRKITDILEKLRPKIRGISANINIFRGAYENN